MALTTRNAGDLISHNFFNDFNNLLKGVMQDQEVTIKNNLQLVAIGGQPTPAPTLGVIAGAGLGTGLYTYGYTWVSPDGETNISATTNATTTGGNNRVNITGIAVGPTGCIGRNIYRSAVGGGNLRFLAAIADNTTTTYSDLLPDSALTYIVQQNAFTFGGSLVIRDYNNFVTWRMTNDGGLNHILHVYGYQDAPPFGPSLALAVGVNLGAGVYLYKVSWGMSDGESLPGPSSTITTSGGNLAVTVTNIPIGPPDTSFRIVYRTSVGGTDYKQVALIFDNVTTTFTDTVADGSRNARTPAVHPSFGGAINIKNQSGNYRGWWYNDGAIEIDDPQGSKMVLTGGNAITINGGTSGTATLYQIMQGTVKFTFISLVNFKTAGGSQSIALPVLYVGTFSDFMWAGDTELFSLTKNGSSIGGRIVTAFGTQTSAGTNAGTSTFYGTNFYIDVASFDTIVFASGWTNAHNGSILIIGI